MRAVPLLLLAACTGTGATVGRATPTQLHVRLAEARHAAQVDLDIFVWPVAAPAAEPTSAQCDWWADRQGGRPTAIAGLNGGTLGWGAIHITQSSIGFGGKDLLDLTRGRLSESQVDGAVIPALYTVVVDARRALDSWYEACGDVYRDRPLLVVDADVPQTTVSAVLSTLSNARFPRLALLVGDRDPSNQARKSAKEGVLAVVRQQGAQVEIMDSTGLFRLSGPVADSESMLAKATAGAGFGCTLLVPAPEAKWADVAATIDTTTAFGSASTLIADASLLRAESPWNPGPAAEPTTGKTPSEWLSLDNTAAVHWVDLPDLQFTTVAEPTPVACSQLHGAVRETVEVSETLALSVEALAAPRVRECRSVSCLGVLLVGDPVSEPTIELGWTVFGGVDLGTPAEPVPALLPALAALRACPPPLDQRPAELRRAVAWLEVAPDGSVPEHQVEYITAADKVWAECLLSALGGLKGLPTQPDGRYSAVELRIDSAIPPL